MQNTNYSIEKELVVGIREIPFRLAVQELQKDPMFAAFAIQTFSTYPQSTYQSFFESNCDEKFLDTIQRLSADDWSRIGKYHNEPKKQEPCNIISRMDEYQSEMVVDQPRSYSQIANNGSSDASFNKSDFSMDTSLNASTVEDGKDVITREHQDFLSMHDNNFQKFQTNLREKVLPQQTMGSYYSDCFRMAVDYYADFIGKKIERDLKVLESEFESYAMTGHQIPKYAPARIFS